MRIEIDSRVYLPGLPEALAAAIGSPVTVSVRQPGQLDRDGHAIPGVVVLTDPETGEDLEGLDESLIRRTLAEHKKPQARETPVESLAKAINAANTLKEVKAAVCDFANAATAERKSMEARRAARAISARTSRRP